MNLPMKKHFNYYYLIFSSFLIIGCATIPIMLINNGSFYLVGDYMTQQIPFVKECRRMLLSGSPFWSWNTFLGSNFLGTYSFYNYCSPFFWPLFLVPEKFIPAGMGVMFIIKHIVAAVTSYTYLKKHINTPHLCFIGALLYAFSSFSMDASFFYHFIDVIAVFPLILYCTDLVLEKKKQAFLSLAVLLNACINYYFFVGTSVVFIFYLFFRIKFSDNQYGLKDGIRCIVFYAIGGLCSMFILLPSALSLLETNKATSSFFNSLLRGLGNIPQIIKLLKGIILPSEGIMGSATGFQYSVFNSNNAFLPFLGAVFIFISLRKKPKNWYGKLFRFLFFLTLVPYGNGIFSLFTNMSYTRWWYAFVLFEVFISIKTLEDFYENKEALLPEFKTSIKKISVISAVVLGAPLIVKIFSAYLLKDFLLNILPQAAVNYLYNTNLAEKFTTDDLRYAIILLLMIAVNYIPLYISVKKKWIYCSKKSVTAVFLICLSTYSIYLLNETDITDTKYESNYLGSDTSVSEDLSYNYRTHYSYSLANYPMVSNQPGVSIFHSFKSKATTAFCNLVGFDNTLHATSNAHFDTPAIQSVLSIKYTVDKNGTEKEAPCYSPFGYVYEYYVSDDSCDYTTDIQENNKRIELMTTACFVDKETQAKIQDVALPLTNSNQINIAEACKKNTASAVSNFNMTPNGFNAQSDYTNDKLVYFSVPHDRGWKAYINSKETEILTLNGGMMGIIVPAGHSEIEFRFTTPGLFEGIIISIFSLLILLIVSLVYRRKYNTVNN